MQDEERDLKPIASKKNVTKIRTKWRFLKLKYLKKYSWCIIILTLGVIVLCFLYIYYLDSSRGDYFRQISYRLKDLLSENKTDRKKVLIVTIFRSGSSWMGQLISKIPNTFYIFEPLHMYPLPSLKQDLISGYKNFRLEQLLDCGISRGFMTHDQKWHTVHHPRRECKGYDCFTPGEVSEDCLASDLILIKTTRLLLSEVQDLLIKPTMEHLKVIFLVRDPRGTIYSLSTMESSMRKSIDDTCPVLRENVVFFATLKKYFPDKFFFVRYEDIMLQPIEISLEIWRFIFGTEVSQKLPSSWLQYIGESERPKDAIHIGSYDMSIKSMNDWQQWRRFIPEKLLHKVEKDCGDVIGVLGYSTFENIETYRNLSHPILSSRNCSSIPCL